MALPFVVAPLIARDLGPGDRGLYGSAIAGLTLAPVLFGLGLPLAVRREFTAGRGPAATRAAMAICVAVLPLALFVGFLAGHVLLPGASKGALTAFVVASGCAVLQTFGLCLQSSLVVSHRYAAIAAVQIAQSLTMAIGAAGLWWADRMTVMSLLWVFVASIGATVATAAAAARVPLTGDRVDGRGLLGQSVSYAGSQVAETGSNTVIPLLAVLVIGGTESGYLAIAMTVASLAGVLANTLGIMGYRDAAAKTGAELEEFCGLIIRVSLVSAGFLAVVTGALAPWLVPMLFGDAYRSAVGPTVVAVTGAVLYVVNFAASQLLAAQGQGWRMTAAQVGGLALGVIAFIAGAGWAGAVWGATTIALARFVTCVVCLRSLPSAPRNYLPGVRDVHLTARVFTRGLPD